MYSEILKIKEDNKNLSKTYEERISINEEKSKLDCEIKNQFQDDMIKVLKDEIGELTLKLSLKDNEISKVQEKFNKLPDKETEFENLQKENKNLQVKILEITEEFENSKVLVRQQIGIFREELNKLRESSQTENLALQEEVNQLSEIIRVKEDEINRLTEEVEAAHASAQNLRIPTITSVDQIQTQYAKDTYHSPEAVVKVDPYVLQKVAYSIEENIVLKKECEVLVLQLNQQREEYELKMAKIEEAMKQEREQRDRNMKMVREQSEMYKERSVRGSTVGLSMDLGAYNSNPR